MSSPEDQAKKILETHDKVASLSNKIRLIIGEEIKEIKPEFAWLVVARVINSLFASFYQPAMIQAEAEIAKKEGTTLPTEKGGRK